MTAVGDLDDDQNSTSVARFIIFTNGIYKYSPPGWTGYSAGTRWCRFRLKRDKRYVSSHHENSQTHHNFTAGSGAAGGPGNGMVVSG